MRLTTIMALALAFIASASAEEQTTLRTKDHGVLGAMYRVHCRPQWLSVVLRESNLLESQLTMLKPGTLIMMPDECQSGFPAPQDVRATRRILAAFHRLREAENVKYESDALRQSAMQITKERDGLFVRNQILESQLSAAKKIAEYERSCEPQRWILAGIVGFLIASTGWLVLVVVYRRRGSHDASQIETPGEVVPSVVPQLSPVSGDRSSRIPDAVPSLAHPYEPKLCFSVMFHGKRVDFVDTSTRFAGCPLCHEKRLIPSDDYLRRHLEIVHVHLRLEERPADELRRRIAMAQQER